jgi:hypothetical protein
MVFRYDDSIRTWVPASEFYEARWLGTYNSDTNIAVYPIHYIDPTNAGADEFGIGFTRACSKYDSGHQFGEWTLVKEALSCTEPGVEECACACGSKLTRYILGTHVEKTIDAIEPTYTSIGYTEGKECSFCGEILVKPQVLPVLKGISAPEENVAYKMYIYNPNTKELYCADGTVEQNQFLGTTGNIGKDPVADVYVEAVDGGYKFYFLIEEVKYYIHVYLNGAIPKVRTATETESVFVYDAEINAWVTNVDGVPVYLGTYKAYTNISASNTSYINSQNTGVTQFPMGLMP